MKRILFIIIILSSVAASAQRITHNFNNVTMPEALRQLNRMQNRYTINFIFNDLEDFRITTSVKGKSIPDAIQQIIGFYPIEATIVSDSIINVECSQKTALRYKGRVVDASGQPIEFANVALLSPSDSSLINGGVTNASGYFVIPCEASKVIVRVSFVGYKSIERIYTTPNLGTIRLIIDKIALKGVTVKGRSVRPTPDGISVTVENSMLAGLGHASDVLKHLPFVNERNDTYEIIGKGTPLIYVNNRLIRDNTELKQINSSDIKNVKVILNPGAEYDATVNAVIRISTIRAKGEGLSGIVDGIVQRERKVSHLVNANLKYDTGGLEVFGGLKYTRVKITQNQTGKTYMNNWYNEEIIKLKHRYFKFQPTIGADYRWNDRSSAGVRYEYSGTPSSHLDAFANLEAQHHGAITNNIKSTDYRSGDSERHYVNAYCEYRLTDDAYLKLDLDYLNGNSNSIQDYNIGSGSLYTHNKARNQLYAGRFSFSAPLWGGSIKAGTEASYTNNHNDYKVLDDGSIQNAVSPSNNEARQHLLAGYIDYSHSFGKHFGANVGTRYEHTDFDYYESGKKSAESSKSYNGLFPSASVSYNAGDIQLSLAYRYTTRRPSYFVLRNAVAINNPYSYEGGNPTLQPSKTNMLTLTFSWKDLYLLATYAKVNDGIAFINDTFNNNDSISFFQTRNIDSRRLVFSAYYSPTLFNIWKPELQFSLTKPYINYNGQGYNKPRFRFEFSNIVEITPTFKFECMVDYNSSGNLGDEPGYHYSDFYADADCIKTFFNDRLRLNLTVSNIFNTSREKWRLNTNGIDYEKWNDGDRRAFILTVTYRFNQSKSKYKGKASTSELDRL